MFKMNTKLAKHYENHWDKIIALKHEYPKLSNPLLIKVPEGYSKQKVKLMIVGQQTQTWYDDEIKVSLHKNSINKLRDKYEEFLLNGGRRGAFWKNFIKNIKEKLMISEWNIVWSDINRMDYKKKRPEEHIENEMNIKLKKLLPVEIFITKPDLIIFLTGPLFDELLIKTFGNVSYKQIKKRYVERVIAKLKLPRINALAYRIYHPSYLNRPEKICPYTINEMINLIISDYKKVRK